MLLNYPDIDKVKEYALTGKYKRIPIMTEMLSDSITPIELVKVLRQASHQVYLLESASQSETWGRYSFLGFNPDLEITCQDGQLLIK